MEAKGMEVVEGEHFDVIGTAEAAPQIRELTMDDLARVHGGHGPQVVALPFAAEALQPRVTEAHLAAACARWQERALRAEAKVANVLRRLDDYRDLGHAMPTYRELQTLLQG